MSPQADRSGSLPDMHQQLSRHFGFTKFLPGQEAVVQLILEGKDTCVVMPTGAGKSLCYQLPTLMRPGYTVVVSPLISLMLDQVKALKQREINAAFLNSTVPRDRQEQILAETAAGRVKLLYVAPERFRMQRFRNLLTNHPPQMLVVDEAHCISQWGHDFRPDYLRIGDEIKRSAIGQISAFTATATPPVRTDIRRQLGRDEMIQHVSGFQRPNLSFRVVQCHNDAEKLAALEVLLETPMPTIIYTSTRKAVEAVTAKLGGVGYHAGMTDTARHQAQTKFMTERCPVLVATNAFGMGIDRKDVRRVVHYNLPGSVESYYQEAGRAGRDGEPAECVLLFSYQDRFVHEFLLEINNPSPRLLRQIHALLRRLTKDAGDRQIPVDLEEWSVKVPEADSEKHLDAALRILEKYRVIERGFRRQDRGALRFLDDLEKLEEIHQHEKTQRSRCIHRCILHGGSDLTTGVRCSLAQLAQVAGLRVDQTRRVISALQNEVIDWRPPQDTRLVTLIEPENEEPNINWDSLRQKRELDKQRLEQMLKFVRERDCRQLAILNYFGQDPDNWTCGCCDNCGSVSAALLRTPSEQEMLVIREILNTVCDLAGGYGRAKAVDLMTGTKSEWALAASLDRHEKFGCLRQLKRRDLFRLLDGLERAGHITKVGDPRYPCIDITRAGLNALDGTGDCRLDLPKLSIKKRIS